MITTTHILYSVLDQCMSCMQEKVAAAKATSELSSVTAELTRALAEAENLRRQLTSRASEGAKDDLDRIMKHCQQLENELKVDEIRVCV